MLHTAVLALLVGVAPAYALTEAELRKFFEFGEGKLSLTSRIPSWPKQDLAYNIIGDLSSGAGPMIVDYMKRLSAVTGLNIHPGAKTDITFIADETALLDLHDKPQRFRAIGLPDNLIALMQASNSRPPAPGGETCARLAFKGPDGDIGLAIALSQTASKTCIVPATFTVIGVRMDSLDDESKAFHMACILYEGRKIGARTMSEILDKDAQLQSKCAALEQTNGR
jgi:hypothetical protein